jgi:hypothetical protein
MCNKYFGLHGTVSSAAVTTLLLLAEEGWGRRDELIRGEALRMQQQCEFQKRPL